MKLLNELVFNKHNDSSIDVLISDKLPIVIWGCGSLSHSTRRMLESHGLSIAAFWEDNPSSNECEGIPILSYEETEKAFERFDVVVGHSRYDLASDLKDRHPSINNVFCFVNLCYGQWKGISRDFILNHIDGYEKTYSFLSDDLSKKCLVAYLNSRSNDDYRFLLPVCKEPFGYFDNPFFSVSDKEVYCDVGAYNGDTVKEFLKITNNRYERIIAIEPEEDSYRKLVEYIKKIGLHNIDTYMNACWNEDTELQFRLSEESSSINNSKDCYSNTEMKTVLIEAKKIDNQFKNQRISLIKINYLQGVKECLLGAEETLKANKPKLAITVGFDEWGLIDLPQTVMNINNKYKLGLRYASPMPARLILYAW